MKSYGSGAFCREVPCTGPQMRLMQAGGVVQPIVSDAGWRIFSERDLAAARAHMKRYRAASKVYQRLKQVARKKVLVDAGVSDEA